MTARNHRGYWAFLVHRVSGVALALFLPLHFYVLASVLRGHDALDGFLRWSEAPLVKLAETGLVVLLSAHLVGGLRLLLIEFLPWRESINAMLSVSMGISIALGLMFALGAL